MSLHSVDHHTASMERKTTGRTSAWPWLSPGKAWATCLLYFTNPHHAEGSATQRSESRRQSAYPLSLELVLIHVLWHAISWSITFTCQTVHQGDPWWWEGIALESHSVHTGSYIYMEPVTADEQRTLYRVSALCIFVHHIGACSFLMWLQIYRFTDIPEITFGE